MRRTLLSSVASPARPCFYTLSRKRHGFREKENVFQGKVCVFWFFATFIRIFYYSEINSVRYYNLFLSDLNETWIFRQIFNKKKNLDIKFNETPSTRSRSVPCGQVDRRTDVKLILAFCNFANAPKLNLICISNKTICGIGMLIGIYSRNLKKSNMML